MVGWTMEVRTEATDIIVGTAYQVLDFTLQKRINSIDKITPLVVPYNGTITPNAYVVLKNPSNIIFFRGYIKSNDKDEYDYTETYDAFESASEMDDILIEQYLPGPDTYQYGYVALSENVDDIVDIIIDNSAWSIGTIEAVANGIPSSISHMSILDGLFTYLCKQKNKNVWCIDGGTTNRQVFWSKTGALYRNDYTTVTTSDASYITSEDYIKKIEKSIQYKTGFKKIVVTTSDPDVFGIAISGSYVLGDKSAMYQYDEAKSVAECEEIAARIYIEQNAVELKSYTVTMPHGVVGNDPSYNLYEAGDAFTLDGVDVLIKTVDMTQFDIVIKCDEI